MECLPFDMQQDCVISIGDRGVLLKQIKDGMVHIKESRDVAIHQKVEAICNIENCSVNSELSSYSHCSTS